MDSLSFLSELKNRKVVVLGSGVTGRSWKDFLQTAGATVRVIDEKIIGTGIASAPNPQMLSETSLLCVSPGWRKDHPFLRSFIDEGIEVISEIDFAWRMKKELAPLQKWVAVTGTNGKTTTVQMVEKICLTAGLRAKACGNVGTTVIDALQEKNSAEILIIELSSFQLEWSNEAAFDAVAILNIAEDHIDWHGTFDAYAKAKIKILDRTKIAILNVQDATVVQYSRKWNGKKVFYSLTTPQKDELGVVENLLIDRAFIAGNEAAVLAQLDEITPSVPHNVSNALAAAGISRALGIAPEKISEGLRTFELDHHRLQLLHEKDGIRWIDDSKATNPHAALASLQSQLSAIWIAGGLAKNASMDELISKGGKRIKAALLIGKDREIIVDALKRYAPHVEIFRIDADLLLDHLMMAVVKKAEELAVAGDTVLLAPACASMDQFTSYAERGDSFARAVKKMVLKK